MKIKDEIQELILDRFTWLSTTISISLPVLFSLLSNLQNNSNIFFLSTYLFLGLFILVNSIYVLVARKVKPDILIVRSIDNIKKDEFEGKTTAKYPSLQPYAKKSLIFSIIALLISFFVPGFRNINSSPAHEASIPSASPAHEAPIPSASPTQITYTPTATIVYKSPVEMNLQPNDIPSLAITNVQNSTAESIIPEATDQSQLIFTNEDNTDYIESNVIIVPTKTTRTPSELFDLAVSNRHPTIKKTSDEQSVKEIGEQAYLFETSDDCGSGYVLIAIRSNVITIAIGCGADITTDLMAQIGKIIDRRITTSTAEMCAQFNLTSEECANAGTHEYSLLVEPNWCDKPSGGINQITDASAEATYVTFVFMENEIVGMFALNGYYLLKKTGLNTYNSHWLTIYFNSNGYSVDINSNELTCLIHYEKELIK